MAAPGYYISDPAALIVLPRPPRWESEDVALEEADIVNETIRGVRYVNKMFNRRTPSYIFRVPAEEIPEYQALHDAVGGLLRSFYYVVNTAASPLVVLYVKKEADFKPKKLIPGVFNGTLQSWYDYTLVLSEEVTEAEILA